MKKILTIVAKWLIYYFGNRVIKTVEFNAYKVTFRKYTMEITTQSGNMKLIKPKAKCFKKAQMF